jgi:hypothetical protein
MYSPTAGTSVVGAQGILLFANSHLWFRSAGNRFLRSQWCMWSEHRKCCAPTTGITLIGAQAMFSPTICTLLLEKDAPLIALYLYTLG